MQELSGFLASFDRDTVRHNDLGYVSSARTDLIELTVRHRKLAHMELLVNGYDDDPRALYEVPEVRRWIDTITARWADFLFWLTPGSLWTVLLSLNPEMFRRVPDGRLEIRMSTDELIDQVGHSALAGSEVLHEAGLADEFLDEVTTRALTNLRDMFERRQLGEYAVVHPDSGDVVTFSSSAPPDDSMEEET
jgi:hypothetical protein